MGYVRVSKTLHVINCVSSGSRFAVRGSWMLPLAHYPISVDRGKGFSRRALLRPIG